MNNMIDFDKNIYVKMGHRVMFGIPRRGDKFYLRGKIKGSSSDYLCWDKDGVCENGDEDYQLTNSVDKFDES